MNLHINVNDETAQLESVIVGISCDKGQPKLNNPKSREHFERGTYPAESELVREIDNFANVLENLGVKVYRPSNISGQGQSFVRDLGFVIGDKFVKANMLKINRQQEYAALSAITDLIDSQNIIIPPDGCIIEGGDIVLYKNIIFVGQGARTNLAGYEFLKSTFNDKAVVPLNLVVTEDSRTNALHLDCVFSPVGKNCAILYERGFSKRPEAILDLFNEKEIICVSADEAYTMFPNIFSISSNLVISEPGFGRLNDELRKRDMIVLEVPYQEHSKGGGLFRCSTLPLYRK